MMLIGAGLWASIRTGAVQLFILLWSGIYNVATYTFKIFLILAEGSVVDSDTYSTLMTNIYIILGVVMLFVIAFALLQGMVNPDNQKTGTSSMGKMVVNFVTSLMIIVLLPTIFTFLYDVQSSVLSYNTIGKFFGYGSSSTNYSNNGTSIDLAARQIVNGVWTAFFNVTEDYADENGCSLTETTGGCQDDIEGDNKETLAYVINAVDNGASYNRYGQFADQIIAGNIDFNVLISLIAGLALIYVGISYCIDMALRFIKLLFYQLIAPIPVLLRMVPDDKISGTFNQWMKITLSCYFEVYVRIIVLYFCVYICSIVVNSDFLSDALTNVGWFAWLLTRAFLLVGILLFMKQAPKLIGEVTGIKSDGMKLGIGAKLKESGLGAAFGAVAGAGMAVASGAGALAAGSNFTSAVGAARHGWKNKNLQGIGTAVQRTRDLEDARENGSTMAERNKERLRRLMGMETGNEYQNRQLEEGINPKTGKVITATNDTQTAIDIRDTDGNIIETIAVGDSKGMDSEMQKKIDTTKQVNARDISRHNESLRQIKESQDSNNQLKAMRSELKKEAMDKISEEKSTYQGEMIINGQKYKGNLATLKSIQDGLLDEINKDKTLTAAQRSAKAEAINLAYGKAEDSLWKDYARTAIKDTSGKTNGRILGLSEQIIDSYTHGGLQSDVGTSHTFIKNSTTGQLEDDFGNIISDNFDLVEAIDGSAKSYDRIFNTKTDAVNRDIHAIQAQDTALDRMTGQSNEQKEVFKRSNSYRATQSSSDYVSRNGSPGDKK